MMFIFDTSSFVSMARYYLPFDLQGKIYHHVKSSIENGRIVLIDAVLEECRYVGGKIVVEKLDFLDDKDFLKTNNTPVKTEDIIPTPPAKFYNMVDNNFATPRKRILSDIEFEKENRLLWMWTTRRISPRRLWTKRFSLSIKAWRPDGRWTVPPALKRSEGISLNPRFKNRGYDVGRA